MKKYYIWIAPVFFLLATAKEAYIAMQFIEVAEATTHQAISLWATEINISSNYTGAQLGIIQHIDRAFYSLIIFGIFTVFSILFGRTPHA